jgi:hypothetical protein
MRTQHHLKREPALTGTSTKNSLRVASHSSWLASQHFSAYGTRFLIRTNRTSILPALLARLPLGSELIPPQNGHPPDHVYSIVVSDRQGFSAILRHDGRRLAVAQNEGQLLTVFEQQVVSRLVKSARDRVFIHAGVVGWRGRAILIPGRSTHGKTTLVMHFVQAGATYYSDEFALLDSEGLVHPYARPLQVRMQKGSLIQTLVPVEQLGGSGGVGHQPIQPVMLLACRYRENANWLPNEITPGAAVLEMTRHSTSAFRNPHAAFQATSQAASHLKAWRGTRGEAQQVVEWALKLLEAEY